LRTELAEQVSNWQLSILGTDINRKSIERARAARYDDWALRGVSDPLKARYFHRHEKQWELAAEFREDVRFEYHNLTRRWQVLPVVELPKFDVILCRNVLIYFSQEVAQDVVRYLYGRLNDGGWLLVGHAEYGQEALRVLEAVTSHGAVLYRKPAMNCAVTGAGGQQVVGASDATVVAIRSNTHSSRSAQLQPPGKPSALPTRQSVFARAAAATSSKIDAVAPVPTSLSEELHKLRTLADAGRFDLALQSCDELLGRHRMAPACHLHQGLLLVAMDELERAEQALQRAVYLDGAYAPAQYYLGLVRLKQGDSAAAARRFRHTLQLLATRKTASPFVELDGLTADELTELANMHLESTTP
jgi:chemotaxis protein methyltransferase CheR